MIETIHIFDEFKQPAENTSLEIRHQKRMALEPLIFDILKEKYPTFAVLKTGICTNPVHYFC